MARGGGLGCSFGASFHTRSDALDPLQSLLDLTDAIRFSGLNKEEAKGVCQVPDRAAAGGGLDARRSFRLCLRLPDKRGSHFAWPHISRLLGEEMRSLVLQRTATPRVLGSPLPHLLQASCRRRTTCDLCPHPGVLHPSRSARMDPFSPASLGSLLHGRTLPSSGSAEPLQSSVLRLPPRACF